MTPDEYLAQQSPEARAALATVREVILSSLPNGYEEIVNGGVLGRFAEAERELRAAIHADTDYALPYASLAHVTEQRHDTASAVLIYREYLSHASRSAAERPGIEARLARLTRKTH